MAAVAAGPLVGTAMGFKKARPLGVLNQDPVQGVVAYAASLRSGTLVEAWPTGCASGCDHPRVTHDLDWRLYRFVKPEDESGDLLYEFPDAYGPKEGRNPSTRGPKATIFWPGLTRSVEFDLDGPWITLSAPSWLRGPDGQMVDAYDVAVILPLDKSFSTA